MGNALQFKASRLALLMTARYLPNENVPDQYPSAVDRVMFILY